MHPIIQGGIFGAQSFLLICFVPLWEIVACRVSWQIGPIAFALRRGRTYGYLYYIMVSPKQEKRQAWGEAVLT